MAFWGVLVNRGEPYTLRCNGTPKRLRISQATLADRGGIWVSRSVVRCSVGSKSPVYICSLSMKEMHSCQLDLEFEESEDIVFSVQGPRGVHLAGYYVDSKSSTTSNACKIDSKGDEDIEETVGDHSSHYKTDGDEYDLRDSFIDDSAFQISSIPPDPLQSAAMVEFDSDNKMADKHVGEQMASSVETSQQQFIIVKRKNDVEKSEVIIRSAQLEEQLERELVNKYDIEHHNNKLNAVVQDGITEGTDSINVVRNEHEGTTPESNGKINYFSSPQGRKRKQTTMKGERIQQLLTENDNHHNKMVFELQMGALDSNSRRGRDFQTCNSPLQKPEVGPRVAENLKIKKKRSAREKLVSDYVSSNRHNLAMDCSDGETCKDGGYVSASWTSDEPHGISTLFPELGLRHRGKLKKKRKGKDEAFNVLEDSVRDTQNQAKSDGRFDIVGMDQYLRHTTMTGTGDDHMNNPLQNNQQVTEYSVSHCKMLTKIRVGRGTIEKTDFEPSVGALESNSKLQHEKIFSIDGGDAFTKIQSKSKKKKMKKKNHYLDSEASHRQDSQYVFKERKNEVEHNQMIGSACLEEKSCRKSDDKGIVDAIVPDGNVKGIGNHACDSTINLAEVGISNDAKKLSSKTVSERVVSAHNILVGGSNEKNHRQKEMVADYDELGVAGKLKMKKKKKKGVVDVSMVSKSVLSNNQNQAVGHCKDETRNADGHLRQVTGLSDPKENGKKGKKKVKVSRIQEKSTRSDNGSQKIVLAPPATLEAKSKLQHEKQVTDFSVLEDKRKLKKEVKVSRILAKSTEKDNILKTAFPLPATSESKSKLKNYKEQKISCGKEIKQI
ncbi:hypothetical protein L1049_001207 [Liquidambar formosana]|uniref:peptidylprolyl isomerase n=1 Tax=Liquidambar formosana TaxID=63359 RepID=A0AAP0NE96_LIQFO